MLRRFHDELFKTIPVFANFLAQNSKVIFWFCALVNIFILALFLYTLTSYVTATAVRNRTEHTRSCGQ